MLLAKTQSKLNLGSDSYQLQTGFSIKAVLEFAIRSQHPNPILRLTAGFGAGSTFLNSWLYPSVNEELQFYNGGLGSDNRNSFFSNFCLDAITAITVTFGWPAELAVNRKAGWTNRNMPLYYFGDFVPPALQNPFDYSMSLGTNLIFTTDSKKKAQRVGFFNVHLKSFQLSYYNDGGTPMRQTYLGDRSDRYYTGGGVLAFDLPRNTALSSITLSYHKFTGYTRNAFELSNQLYLSYMNYHDTLQKEYNKSLWTLTGTSVRSGLSASVKAYNYNGMDLQHDLHSALFNTFHIVPYPGFWAVSANYFYSNVQIGLK
jgi:hypothetical protein